MVSILFSALIYLIPLAAIAFFIDSLCRYIAARSRYKAEPNESNGQKKQKTKTALIVSSVIMGVLVVVIVSFMALMFTAVAYM